MAFVTVSGTVDYAKRGGKGYAVIEAWRAQGKDFKRSWSIWFDQETTLTVGQPVTITGVFSAKIGDPWEDREGQTRTGGIQYTINKTKLRDSPAPASPAAPTPAAYVPDADVPF